MFVFAFLYVIFLGAVSHKDTVSLCVTAGRGAGMSVIHANALERFVELEVQTVRQLDFPVFAFLVDFRHGCAGEVGIHILGYHWRNDGCGNSKSLAVHFDPVAFLVEVDLHVVVESHLISLSAEFFVEHSIADAGVGEILLNEEFGICGKLVDWNDAVVSVTNRGNHHAHQCCHKKSHCFHCCIFFVVNVVFFKSHHKDNIKSFTIIILLEKKDAVYQTQIDIPDNLANSPPFLSDLARIAQQNDLLQKGQDLRFEV